MSGIGRRIAASIKSLKSSDFESSATSVFQAIDATGRKRFPKAGNDKRFMGLIEEQHDIISAAALKKIHIGSKFNGLAFQEVIWEFGRNPLIHEAELDPKLTFDNHNGLIIGSTWNLPPSYLFGLCLGVISACENKNEDEKLTGNIEFWGQNLSLESLWGSEDFLSALLNTHP